MMSQPELQPVAAACPRCGFNLTGLTVGQRCPECGGVIGGNELRGAAGPRATSGLAIASLVLGIVGVVGCFAWGLPTLICAPLAVVFGHVSRSQIRRSGGALEGSGFAIWGLTLGYIMASILLAGVMLIILTGALNLTLTP